MRPTLLQRAQNGGAANFVFYKLFLSVQERRECYAPILWPVFK
jgi:hypothetical protein